MRGDLGVLTMDHFPHVNEARFDWQTEIKGEINPLLMTLLLEKQEIDGGKESSASFKGCGKLKLPKELATKPKQQSWDAAGRALKSIKDRLASIKNVEVRN